MQAKVKCNIKSLPKPKDYEKVKKTGKSVEKNVCISECVHRYARSYTKAQDDVIIQMRNEGRSYAEIADEIGKSKEAIRRRWYAIRGFV